MKYSISIVGLAASIASAVSISDLPSCALSCITDAISSSTNCALSDQACQCTAANEAAITSAATPCVLKACSTADAETTLKVSQEICADIPSSSSVVAVATSSSAAESSSAAAATTTTTGTTTAVIAVSTSNVTSTATGASSSASQVPFTGAGNAKKLEMGRFAAVIFAAAAVL